MLGFVKRINSKTGQGKRGPWTLYSMLTIADDGVESGWVSLGFDKPPFMEGDYISYDTNKTDRGLDYVSGSFKKLVPPAKETSQTLAQSDKAPAKAQSSYVDRNDSIVYQSSRKDALALVGLLLEHDGLPVSASAAKAGQAKRFEEIKGFVDKLTVEYFNDVQSGRVLRNVVDAGAEAEEDTSEHATGLTADDND